MKSTSHVALHGFACAVPAHWEVAVNRGARDAGHVMLVERREPQLNISWNRRNRTVDCDRTLRRLARTMFRDRRANLAHVEEFDHRGAWARYDGPDGSYHAVAFCPDPDSTLALVVRQLVPASRHRLLQLASQTTVAPPEGPVPWRIHGLAADLSPGWQLSGINHYTGLVRGLWLHQLPEKRRRRHDQVLVLRRFACASRVLDARGIEGWVNDRLAKREVLTDSEEADGLWRGWCQQPREGWVHRRWGSPRRRHLQAWLEPEMDRLVVQEWYGRAGEPPPAQRHPDALATSGERAA